MDLDEPFVAAIFDMDGLLVDSEPLWREAEIDVLGPLGVPIDQDQCRRTKGMFVEEVTRYWFERFPWRGPSPETVAVAVVDRVVELVLAKAQRQPGVDQALDLCRSHGLRLGLASSSQYRLIAAVLEHFGLAGTFSVVHSAEEEPYGKPHPGVYVTAARKLAAPPDRCLAWEDAAAGVLAAKAARMTCVAVPDAADRGLAAFAIADAVLSSLEEADEVLWQELAARRLTDPLG